MCEMTLSSKPVIGILCVDRWRVMPENAKSYIRRPYVRLMENAGAEVVPIYINKDRAYYELILSQVNGVVFQGGQVFINNNDPERAELTNYCVQAAEIIIEIAQRKCDEGNPLPILAICLGFQLLVLYATPSTSPIFQHIPYGTDPREECSYMNVYLPVVFTKNIGESRLFGHLSAELRQIMETQPVFPHSHHYCVSVKSLVDTPWRILGTNMDVDADGVPCKDIVTFLEHRNYPFYGSQVHPERVYERPAADLNSDSDPLLNEKLLVAKYFGDFFIGECRKNTSRFPDCAQLEAQLIRNSSPTIWETEKRQYFTFTQ